MHLIKLTLAALLALLLVGCATPIPLNEQSPDANYLVEEKVLVAVVDNRARVSEGKSEEFIGVVHSAFGIPFDWHVNPVLATEDGDKEKNLSEFIGHRVVTGLDNSGWNVALVQFDQYPSVEQVQQQLVDNQSDLLLLLELHEWFFKINLNWVTAFNFDTETSVFVYDSENGKVFEERYKDRDVIEEKSNESPQNNILRAYKAQLQEILNEEALIQVLSGE